MATSAETKLHIKIKKADNLPLATLRPTPNPYIVISVNQQKVYRTQSISHTSSPTWNEAATFDLPSLDAEVELNIMDDIRMFPDTSFGKVIITPAQLKDARNKEQDLALKLSGDSALSISIMVVTTTLISLTAQFQFRENQNHRRGLLIGINYRNLPEGQGRLSGCVNDVKNIRNLLKTKFNYNDSHFRELNDDPSTPANLQPTRQNILAGMNWLVEGAKSGDHLVFHFSGHGGQVNDISGDEKDGKDECVFPSDFRTAGSIVDDDIYRILVKNLPAGCQLFSIMDCCHSGTGMDLPFEYKELGTSTTPNTLGLPKPHHIPHTIINNFSSRRKKVNDQEQHGDVILISGCKDEETSTDAIMAGKASGAMTYALIRTLQNKNEPITYGEMLKEMRTILKQGRFSQAPQLSASVPFDFTKTKVVI